MLKYNDTELYSTILAKTYDDYLPSAEQNAIKKDEFINNSKRKILLDEQTDLPFKKDENEKYNYGIIVFCPHKTGELGVQTYVDYLIPRCPNDKIVFFKGSGNALDQDEQDKLSFENLKLFKEDEASVMIATKAFGMGIDKPNVRITIHSNISSSIESFVQESGRAGRDGKTSLSIILYNNQISRDRDVLEKFYKTSFKGADKERSVIWELRNKIFFPNTTNLRLLNDKLNEEFDEEFILKSRTIDSYLFVNDNAGNSIINIRLSDKTGFPNIENRELTNSIYEFIKDFIPNFLALTSAQLKTYFSMQLVVTDAHEGLEQLLNTEDFDDSEDIKIPFKNMYFCKSENGLSAITDEFAFDKHYSYFKQSKLIQWLLVNKKTNEDNLKTRFRNAIEQDNEFEKFISNFEIVDDLNEQILNEAKIKYYIPRNQDDTAKAIYRLTSIGIIDSYTIEYQQKVYNVKLSKKTNDQYFDNYQSLVERYTSPKEAERLREACQNDFNHTQNATVISKCLEHLTKFIYGKIAKKRKRAIDDMVSLCDETIVISHPIEQSKKIKENIYYYFNAKYSRDGNVAQIKTGETIDADLNKDFVDNLPIEETIWKYIEMIIDYDDNGAIVNNIKHLRGATMRMLRGKAGKMPQFNILKSYSLYLLSKDSPQLISEAIEELKIGINDWNELEPNSFKFEEFFFRFKNNLKRHIEISDKLFGDIDDEYYVTKNLSWIKKFNHNFLKNYNNAITTSN